MALVVLSHREQLTSEVHDLFASMKAKTTKGRAISIKLNEAAIRGTEAGNSVDLNRSVPAAHHKLIA